jgi:shikimate kinase
VPSIYLVGFMGAGKSAVGAALAARLGRSLVDLDEAVEERLGMTVRDVFSRRGETGFRTAETAELARTAEHDDLVVATGGGAFASPENRALVDGSGGISVFLDPPWEVIARRLDGAAEDRPRWVDADHARRLLEARRPGYLAATVHLRLSGGETPEEVADLVMDALAETACVS